MQLSGRVLQMMRLLICDEQAGRLARLAQGAVNAPPGKPRIAAALLAGALCHLVFAMAILSMVYAMFHGLTQGVGRVVYPWAVLSNAILIIQFPVIHSLLLTRRGKRLLSALIPGQYGRTLGTTTYAIIASLQLLLLFWCWTPSGIVWWQAQGIVLYAISLAYCCSWLLLAKAIFDAGLDLHSGALGWLSLLANKLPEFPDMPTKGLFSVVRQPIYLAFALTLWTVPVWTPDQLALAVIWTFYCVMAPLLKEKRFHGMFKARFKRYQHTVPYMIPTFLRQKNNHDKSIE